MASRRASDASEVSLGLSALKAWIAEQEEYVRQHGRPPPLTEEQRLAMFVLVPRPPPPPSPSPSPSLSPLLSVAAGNGDDDLFEVDWVSLLMRYTQTYKGAHIPPKYDEEQVARRHSSSPLWRYRCQVREAPDRWFPDIPREDAGGGAVSDAGLYSRKKDARQYAARCAVKWLMSSQYMPPDGKSVTFSPGTSRLQQQQQQQPPPPPPPLPSKRPFSEFSLREATPAQQGRPSQQPQPQPQPQSQSQSQPQPPSQPQPQPSPPLPPFQAAPGPAAAAAPTPKADPLLSFETLFRPAYSAPASPSNARIQSMASWQRSHSKGSAGAGAGTGAGSSGGKDSVDRGKVSAMPDLSAANTNTNNSSSSGGRARAPFSDSFEDVSNTHRLDVLCRVLKVGTPTYDLQAGNEGAKGIFSGRVRLVPSSGKNGSNGSNGSGAAVTLPPGVGEVQDVFTKKAAREKAAQSVLDYLQSRSCGSA